MKRELRWYDALTMNLYYLGLSTLSQTMTPFVVPLLVQQFVGEERKGTFFGILRLWGLMVALLTQALMGMLSDRSMSRWGRRRPFILGGTLGDLIVIAALLLSTATLSGMTGFWALFVLYLLLQFTSNTAHAATQGLIPDLAPLEKQGRFAAVKSLLEAPLSLILVSLTVARFIHAGKLAGGLLVVAGVLTLTALATLLVPERPRETSPPPLDWQPFLRVALMTGAFTGVILCLGEAVKGVGRALEGVGSLPVHVVVLGLGGLLATSLAIGLGVWGSVRIGIGKQAAQRNPAFTWWVMNRLAFLVSAFNISGFALYFIQSRLGYTQEQAAGPVGQMMLFIGVAILFSTLPSGWLTDKFGPRRMVAFSGCLAATGMLILLLSPRLVFIYAGSSIVSIATGIFYTANWALGTRLVPREEAGRYLGISNLAGAGAGAVGAYLNGPLIDHFTVHAPQFPALGCMLVFTIYGLLFLLSLVALARIRSEESGVRSEE
ncbi:MAG: MFS transporter [Chloroflexota bacterium]|nr:MFS transporter [Chloroflexota bacterium]